MVARWKITFNSYISRSFCSLWWSKSKSDFSQSLLFFHHQQEVHQTQAWFRVDGEIIPPPHTHTWILMSFIIARTPILTPPTPLNAQTRCIPASNLAPQQHFAVLKWGPSSLGLKLIGPHKDRHTCSAHTQVQTHTPPTQSWHDLNNMYWGPVLLPFKSAHSQTLGWHQSNLELLTDVCRLLGERAKVVSCVAGTY